MKTELRTQFNTGHSGAIESAVCYWHKRFAIIGLVFFFALTGLVGPSSEPAKAAQSLEQRLNALSTEDLEELFTFVAGNSLFTLYHEGGHMLVSELGLPVLGQEEDAVDNLATVIMLAAENEDMDVYLSNAMIGWFLISEENYESLVFYGEHDLNQQRGFRMLCLMVGSDEDTFGELARDLDLPDERAQRCQFDYDQASLSWEAVTDQHARTSGTPGGRIAVSHEPADQNLDLMEIFLHESELLEITAEQFDTMFALPQQVKFTAKMCGVENAYWDPSAREVTLCYELMAGFAEVYLDLLANN